MKNFLSSTDRPISQNHRRNLIRAVKAAFKWAGEQEHIDRSPIRHVKVPAAVPRRPGRSLAGTSRLQASMDRLPGPPHRCLLNRAARAALGSAVSAAHQIPLSMDRRLRSPADWPPSCVCRVGRWPQQARRRCRRVGHQVRRVPASPSAVSSSSPMVGRRGLLKSPSPDLTTQIVLLS